MIERLLGAIEFLKHIRKDYQLDKSDLNYTGFINLGVDITDGELQTNLRHFVDLYNSNPPLVSDLLSEFGLYADKITLFETVICNVNNYKNYFLLSN
jgi:hypothetical protein